MKIFGIQDGQIATCFKAKSIEEASNTDELGCDGFVSINKKNFEFIRKSLDIKEVD